PTHRALAQGGLGHGGELAVLALDGDGILDHDVLVADNGTPLGGIAGPGRRLQVPLVHNGSVVGQPSLAASRAWCQHARAELPAEARRPDAGHRFETLVEVIDHP
ncbi:MAG: hypothetical protein AAGK32_18615, partial [Actinomycetota bacterium]